MHLILNDEISICMRLLLVIVDGCRMKLKGVIASTLTDSGDQITGAECANSQD